jgi:hypothetical protein
MGVKGISNGTSARTRKAGAPRAGKRGDPVPPPEAASVADAASGPPGPPSLDEIAKRAYDLFLSRGASHGDDLADWFQAERDLTNGNQRGQGNARAASRRRKATD